MKSNRTAVKALRSGCGKCSERGLGPCADGIAAAKKRWGPGSGRAAEGHSGGLPRGLGADCCWGFRAVTARCQQASCCVCGVRAGGGAVERWSGGASGVSGGCGDLCRVAARTSERWRAVLTGRVLRLRGPGGRWSGGASGVSGGCGNLCRVAAGASERWRRGVNGTRVAFAGSGRVKNGNRGVKQLSAAGSRGPGDVSGRRVSGIARLGWLEGKGGAE